MRHHTLKIGNNYRITIIRAERTIGLGFYIRQGHGWRTRHIFFRMGRKPINLIGW